MRIAVLLAVLAVPVPVFAGGGLEPPADPSALALFEQGQQLYNNEEFDAAIVAWEKGYAETPEPVFQFWIAEAHRLMGRCVEARKRYEAFLLTQPPPDARELATDGLLACKTDPNEAAGRTEPKPQPEPVATTRAPIPSGDIWYRDITAGVLVGAGVVSLGIGAGFTLAAASSRSGAQDAETLDEFRQHDGALGTRRLVAVVGYVAGAALVGAGVYRWIADSDDGDSIVVTSWLGGGGAGVGCAGRF